MGKWGIRMVVILFCFITACSSEPEQVTSGEDKVVLEFYSPKVETEAVFETLIEEFEFKNNGIDIQQVVVPRGMTVLKTRMARGDVPDLFITYPIEEDYLIRARKGYLEDLTDEPFLKDIESHIQDRYLVDGRMYGAALTQNAVGVLYNKRHFEKLNLSVPSTWEEWIDTMHQMEDEGYTPFIMPNGDVEQTSVFTLNFVANAFSQEYWEKRDYEIVNDPQWNELAEKTLQVLPFTQADAFEDSYQDAIEKFAKEQGSMMVMGTWALPLIDEVNPELEYGIFPFPADQSEQHPVLGGVDIGIAISSATEHPEEAKKFLSFLIQKDQASKLSNYEGSISTIEGVMVEREEVKVLEKKLRADESVNWPNHYWDGGTAAEADYRKYTLEFLIHQDSKAYLSNLENMFEKYEQDSGERP
ncbi:extracellular solute-binding protein [Halobacillus litoralis]|uniref:ABC transporter substrate-binding protein n=1 Tax=Halobacillus litoralis TaxID=45668 RepID=UPI001CD3B884|nr:extracellular solute-binding protein [Halobacillus litoralis]MCA0972105.1 extracellular solute-binding protein [Halobacillus litoralis]